MLKNKIIRKNVILKFLPIITLLFLTALILRSGFVEPTLSDTASGAGRRSSSQGGKGCDMDPTGVEARDYFLNFIVQDMPDKQFNSLPARIEVHKVFPVYKHGKCNPEINNPAIVMIQGRSIPGPVVFDTWHPTSENPGGGEISLQVALAWAGIDTFAPSLLGYGRSTRFDNGLNDRCNASLPPYQPGGCSNPSGCDKS